MENGLVITRPRFTSLRKRWSCNFRFLTDSDKLLLTTMQTAVNVGSGTIDWLNPKDSIVYEVRLEGPIAFAIEPENIDYWSGSFEMIEA
jgi:hypothetical protein